MYRLPLPPEKCAIAREQSLSPGQAQSRYQFAPVDVVTGARRFNRGGWRRRGGPPFLATLCIAAGVARGRGRCPRFCGSECQHSQQDHLDAAARIGCQVQIATPQQSCLVKKLDIPGRQLQRQLGDLLLRQVIFAIAGADDLVDRDALQVPGKIIEQPRVVRKLLVNVANGRDKSLRVVRGQ